MTDDPRGGAEKAEAFYKQWPIAQTAVKLYSAGVSWRGADIFGSKGEGDRELLGHLDAPSLNASMPDWFIRGKTILRVSTKTPFQVIESGGIEIELLTPAGGLDIGPGYTMLWPACANHDVLLEMLEAMREPRVEATASIVASHLSDMMYRSLEIPSWAFDPSKVGTADLRMVTMELHYFRLKVEQWRHAVAFSIERKLSETIGKDLNLADVWLDWCGTWIEKNDGWIGVYETFKSAGMPLTRFAGEYEDYLRRNVELGFGLRKTLEEWQAATGG